MQVLFNGADMTNELDLKRQKEEAEKLAQEKSEFLAQVCVCVTLQRLCL